MSASALIGCFICDAVETDSSLSLNSPIARTQTVHRTLCNINRSALDNMCIHDFLFGDRYLPREVHLCKDLEGSSSLCYTGGQIIVVPFIFIIYESVMGYIKQICNGLQVVKSSTIPLISALAEKLAQ